MFSFPPYNHIVLAVLFHVSFNSSYAENKVNENKPQCKEDGMFKIIFSYAFSPVLAYGKVNRKVLSLLYSRLFFFIDVES